MWIYRSRSVRGAETFQHKSATLLTVVRLIACVRGTLGANVLQAAKTAGKDSADGYFDVGILDDFVRLSVQLGAFDHVRWGPHTRLCLKRAYSNSTAPGTLIRSRIMGPGWVSYLIIGACYNHVQCEHALIFRVLQPCAV